MPSYFGGHLLNIPNQGHLLVKVVFLIQFSINSYSYIPQEAIEYS